VNLPFQPSLFGAGNPAPDESYSTLRRCQLDDESWVDVAAAWMSGADTLFEDLAGSPVWDQRERWMHGRRIIEPRLTCGWTVGESPPPLDDLAALLSQRYGVAFDSIWANYYRDGRDSVTWHGDRVRFRCSARWSPSCRWVVAGGSGCGRAAVVAANGSPSTVATCS
jgi:hypothetical protein